MARRDDHDEPPSKTKAPSKKGKPSGDVSTWKAAVVVVLLLAAGVGAFVAYDYKNDFQHETLAAAFAGDSGEVLLVRPTLLAWQRNGIDLWWVSASTGRVLKTARETAPFGRDLRFVGFGGGRAWFYHAPRALVSYGITRTAGSDRMDYGAAIAAHPTLSASFSMEALDDTGVVVSDQRAHDYHVDAAGRITEVSFVDVARKPLDRRVDLDGAMGRLGRVRTQSSILGAGTPSLGAIPLVRAGFPVDDDYGRAIAPREGGGFLVLGAELKRTAGAPDVEDIARVDARGAIVWQVRLIDTLGDTALDNFSLLRRRDIDVQVRAVHTSPGRVQIVYEASKESRGEDGKVNKDAETRVVELDAATGRVLRAVQPRQ